jgi:hypothetical protein
LINLNETKTLNQRKQDQQNNSVKRSSSHHSTFRKSPLITPIIHYSTLKNNTQSNCLDQLIMNRASNGTYSFVDPNKIHLFVKVNIINLFFCISN